MVSHVPGGDAEWPEGAAWFRVEPGDANVTQTDGGLGDEMFQFNLLTKGDWALVAILAGAIALILAGAVYWLTS